MNNNFDNQQIEPNSTNNNLLNDNKLNIDKNYEVIDTDTNQEKPKPEKQIGKFLLSIFFSIITGLFSFIKSYWLLLLVIIIGFILYYLYSNAVNFLSEFLNIFNFIKPMINTINKLSSIVPTKSNIDISNTTVSTTDISNLNMPNQDISNNNNNETNSDKSNFINTLTKSTFLDKNINKDASLETSLKHTKKATLDLDEDEDKDHNEDKTQDKFNINNLTPHNNNHDIGESGYCFIGNDASVRSCAPIGKNNKCMSGEIFPTLEICMNPNLRE